ncbi:MAG: hypothetical protein ABI654_12060 [Betaproteobacteria bacterium]
MKPPYRVEPCGVLHVRWRTYEFACLFFLCASFNAAASDLYGAINRLRGGRRQLQRRIHDVSHEAASRAGYVLERTDGQPRLENNGCAIPPPHHNGRSQ